MSNENFVEEVLPTSTSSIAPELDLQSTVLFLTDEQELLFKWGCEELFFDFSEKGINLESFKEMTENDIANLIPKEKYGLRIKFRTALLKWRQENGFPVISTADTLSLNSSTFSWVTESNFDHCSSPASSIDNTTEIFKDNNNKNLEEILKNSFVGKSLLDIHQKKESLTFKTRSELCDIIAHHWIINKYEHVLSSQYCKEILLDIVKFFPKEDKEYYISSDKTRKGQLAQKYYSLTRKYREKGVIESRYKTKKTKIDAVTITNNTLIEEEKFEIDEGMLGSHSWLKSNKQPEALVVDKWRSTFILRRKHIQEDKDIFCEWPILKQQIGVSLIELDFDQLYPGKSQLLFSKWDEFKVKILEVYKKNIKDSASKKQLELLSEEISVDSQNYLLCILLNSILTPSGIHSKTKEGNKFFWKPSILQGQTFMILQVETENDIHNVVKNHRENLLERGLTNQPLIIVVGELRELKKIFINLNNFIYELDSFLKALSVIIQIFYTLNLEFPQPCKQVYQFIVSYFYNISIETKKSNQLLQLMLELKS